MQVGFPIPTGQAVWPAKNCFSLDFLRVFQILASASTHKNPWFSIGNSKRASHSGFVAPSLKHILKPRMLRDSETLREVFFQEVT